MTWTLVVVLLMAWLLGLLGGVGGSYIHLLLVAAATVLGWALIGGCRRDA